MTTTGPTRGSIAAVSVLEQLCRAGVPLSELRKPYERYAASGEINTTVDDPKAVIEKVPRRSQQYVVLASTHSSYCSPADRFHANRSRANARSGSTAGR